LDISFKEITLQRCLILPWIHRDLDPDDAYGERGRSRYRGDRAAVLDFQEDQEEWLTVMFIRR